MNLLPKKVFLTKGVGKDKEKLRSYEKALRNAGIAQFNLVSTSSIFPPKCKLISKKEGLSLLKPGQIVFTVMSKNFTNEPHRLITASVGLAIPKDDTQYGYLSEHSSFGETEEKAGEYAEDLAATMLATILGLKFDPDSSYDEKREIWKMSGQIVKTTHITQSAIGDKNGLWTAVVAAAVFIL
ncbi:MAG: arginine decarboxylase, pyruvoyl-dependent [Candidatus Omnitrophota bacterium]|nr:MAG: arginine decarboxylase, pyruvoyl-dependent [Candidatus Omnitrophota bacterium]